jgi:hypothetical protein
VDGERQAFQPDLHRGAMLEGSQGIHPLDHESLNSAASRERRTDSSPQVPLVVINAMPVEKGPVLLLKGLSTVMFTLPFDIPNHICQLGLAYGESTISILPGKGTSAKRLVEPKTRPARQ